MTTNNINLLFVKQFKFATESQLVVWIVTFVITTLCTQNSMMVFISSE